METFLFVLEFFVGKNSPRIKIPSLINMQITQFHASCHLALCRQGKSCSTEKPCKGHGNYFWCEVAGSQERCTRDPPALKKGTIAVDRWGKVYFILKHFFKYSFQPGI